MSYPPIPFGPFSKGLQGKRVPFWLLVILLYPICSAFYESGLGVWTILYFILNKYYKRSEQADCSIHTINFGG
jgi:hypothetical protein